MKRENIGKAIEIFANIERIEREISTVTQSEGVSLFDTDGNYVLHLRYDSVNNEFNGESIVSHLIAFRENVIILKTAELKSLERELENL